MPVCLTCKCLKDEDEFNWKNKSRGERKNYCRTCDREIKKRHYQRHRERVISDNVKYAAERRRKFSEWKNTLRCGMCGETDGCCLEFHHRDPSVKDETIARFLTDGSLQKLIKELNKCVCVCANCHRKIHKHQLSVDHLTNAGEVFMDTHGSSKPE